MVKILIITLIKSIILTTVTGCSSRAIQQNSTQKSPPKEVILHYNKDHGFYYRLNSSLHSDQELLLKLQQITSLDFGSEISILKRRLPKSLLIINNAIRAYKEKRFEESKRLFFSIDKNDACFEYMVHCFSQCLNGRDDYKLLARLIYESSLRHIQVLEQGCVIGLQRYYGHLIAKDPLKKERSRELLVGSNGAMVQFYLCIKNGGISPWAKKAAENYELGRKRVIKLYGLTPKSLNSLKY